MSIQYYIVVLGLFLASFRLEGQDLFKLSGTVRDPEGRALSGVLLEVERAGGLGHTESAANGQYQLFLPRGIYQLSLRKKGYKTHQLKLSLEQDIRQDFTLDLQETKLQTVEVYAKSKSEKLRESSYFVNSIDLTHRAGGGSSLSDLIDRSSGVKIRREGGLGSDYDFSINGMSGSSVRYFIDGIPLSSKVLNLNMLPVNIIERVDVYKGVVPVSLGGDALGGAVNIVTKKRRRSYLDLSYCIGSFHTHLGNIQGQYFLPRLGFLVKSSLAVSYAKNDYLMREISLWDESARRYQLADRRRFHDSYRSLVGQLELGFIDQPWADALLWGFSYSGEEKELQTGAVQSKVYGMAERKHNTIDLSLRYEKRHFIWEGLDLKASLSQSWSHQHTIDTAYRKYSWDGTYTPSPRNEITGRNRSIRHRKTPLLLGRLNLNYELNDSHSLNLNYLMSHSANERWDDVDQDFTPARDLLSKHILGLSYQQRLLSDRLVNTLFLKSYTNHLRIEQSDLYWITGAHKAQSSISKTYLGGGLGARYSYAPELSVKLSYERSIRLPLARELLGNGTTIYANVALEPEKSHNLNLGSYGSIGGSLGHRLRYELNGFLRYVDNYIQASISEKEGMVQYENIPAIHIKGLEMELEYSWHKHWQLVANMSYQDARDQRKTKRDGKPSATYQNRVPNRPWLFANAELRHQVPHLLGQADRLNLSLSYQWIHWYYLTWEAYGAAESKARIPQQHILNAAIAYTLSDGRYGLSLECTNLLDRPAYDNYKLQKPGRAFFLKFRVFIQ